MLFRSVGDHTLLFPGDAQWGTWDVILNTPEWQSSLKRITFLKVGHHGSHNATPTGFVEGGYLHDVTAMVSVADTVNTSEGWKAIPRTELLTALTKAGVTRLVRSDKPFPGAAAAGVVRPKHTNYTEIAFPIGRAK